MEFKYEGKSLKSGIYKITNTLNGRIYVGSAKRFKERWTDHKNSLFNGKHSNKFLQRDFLKCGADAFVFEVLEVVDGSKEERLIREDVYLTQYFDNQNQCYNIRITATSTEGNFTSTEETSHKRSLMMKVRWADPVFKEKMRLIHKTTHKPPTMKGKKHTEETKKKIGEKHKGKHVSKKTKQLIGRASKRLWSLPEHREKMSLAHQKKA